LRDPAVEALSLKKDQKSSSSIRKLLTRLALVVPLVAVVFLVACGGEKTSTKAQTASAGPPPAPVTVAQVAQRSVPLQITAIGNAQPYRTVQVKSMVDGQISQVLFEQGQFVKKGQLLFVIDKRPFQAALNQAQAKLAEDKATAAYNQTMAKKYNSLARQGIVAQQVADQQQALATSNAATLQADEAAVQTAKVNLGYTDIRAPISARAGAILVNIGNLVKANDTTALTTLNQIQPIYVQFNIPEGQLPAVQSNGGVGHLKVDAYQPNVRTPATGTLTFINNTVDQTTGTIELMGTFPNQERTLWPGEFLNVQLMLGVEPHATVVPAKAVQTGQTGQYVYVVRPDNTAVMQPVVSPRTYGQLAVIKSGLNPGERVIVGGQIGVIPNGKVDVVQTVPVTPANSGNLRQVAQNTAAQNAPATTPAIANDPPGGRP
jgi:membrane fusion protein, multidrug efflux system